MLKKLVIFSTLSFVFFVLGSNAQKLPEEPSEARPAQTVERESPPPREESRTETPRQADPPPSSTSPNSTSSPSSNDSPRSDSENSSENRRRRDRDDKTPSRRKLPPPETDDNFSPGDNPPSPPPNQTQNPAPPNTGGNNNQGRNRNWDNDRDDKNRRRRRNHGGWDSYSTPVYVPSSSPAPRPFSANAYFGSNDVFFNIYDITIESDNSRFAPFFEDSPSEAFQPLYYTYGREFFTNEFHFVSTDWAIYYEPDLDDIFINLAKFGQVKFERMILYPVGDTIKKANQKFGYKGQFARPVLVEKIPEIGADKLYSFSIHDLPKGEYELRLIARDGSTARHFIRLK